MINTNFPPADKNLFLRRIRSFVQRDGRMTQAQRRVLVELWPMFGLTVEKERINFENIFKNQHPTHLEIGFGNGYSLLCAARENPNVNFIGIETYQPGIGTLLLNIEQENLQNIRLFYHDAVQVLEQCIPDDSLHGVQIFFPDPWPKRRHHKRRLIQPEFTTLISQKLVKQGIVHLATDWEHYALQMMQVLSAHSSLINLAGADQFADRSLLRPIFTKFEQRGKTAGRIIRELQFQRC